MEKELFKLSHHSIETTSCALALCNTEVESNHLLAVGSDTGSVDLVNLETRDLLLSLPNAHSNNIINIDFL